MMRILVADDDPMARHLLTSMLSSWGYEVVGVPDGDQAREILHGKNPPRMAILDWMMPGMTGLDVCRSVRESASTQEIYLLVLTSRDRREDIVEALEAGADDYVTKPFSPEELRARLQVSRRILGLQQSLAERVLTLEEALQQVKQLEGMLPICCYCKRAHEDQSLWQQIEGYIVKRSNPTFSHGVCPDCKEKFVTPQLEKWRRQRAHHA